MRRSRPGLACVAAGIAVLLLAGCQRTVLSQPPGESGGCDPALRGHWLSLANGSSGAGELEATLGDDCQLQVVEHGREAPRHWPMIRVASARIGRRDLLWLDATTANRGFEVATGPVDREGSVYVFAYRVDDDTVTLLRPDHRRLARRVVDGEIEGAAFADGSDLVVRLDGEPAVLAALLGERRSFTRDDSLRFRRAPADAGQ